MCDSFMLDKILELPSKSQSVLKLVAVLLSTSKIKIVIIVTNILLLGGKATNNLQKYPTCTL